MSAGKSSRLFSLIGKKHDSRGHDWTFASIFKTIEQLNDDDLSLEAVERTIEFMETGSVFRVTENEDGLKTLLFNEKAFLSHVRRLLYMWWLKNAFPTANKGTKVEWVKRNALSGCFYYMSRHGAQTVEIYDEQKAFIDFIAGVKLERVYDKIIESSLIGSDDNLKRQAHSKIKNWIEKSETGFSKVSDFSAVMKDKSLTLFRPGKNSCISFANGSKTIDFSRDKLNEAKYFEDNRTGNRLRMEYKSDSDMRYATEENFDYFKSWMMHSFEDEEMFKALGRHVGSLLVTGGGRMARAIWLHGEGRDGKSFLLETIVRCLGGIAGHAQDNMIVDNGHNINDSALTFKQTGGRLAVIDELDYANKSFKEKEFKNIVAKNPIQQTLPRVGSRMVDIDFALMLASNGFPEVSTASRSAVANRCAFYQLKRVPEHVAVKSVGLELERNPQFLGGCLRWILNGVDDFVSSGNEFKFDPRTIFDDNFPESKAEIREVREVAMEQSRDNNGWTTVKKVNDTLASQRCRVRTSRERPPLGFDCVCYGKYQMLIQKSLRQEIERKISDVLCDLKTGDKVANSELFALCAPEGVTDLMPVRAVVSVSDAFEDHPTSNGYKVVKLGKNNQLELGLSGGEGEKTSDDAQEIEIPEEPAMPDFVEDDSKDFMTVFDSMKNPRAVGKIKIHSLGEVKALLERVRDTPSDNEDGQYALKEYDDNYRNNDNAKASSYVVIDVDSGQSFDDATKELNARGIGNLLVTTKSHTPAVPRYRVIFKAKGQKLLDKDDTRRICETLGIDGDINAMNKSQAWRMPVPTSQFTFNDGRDADWDKDFEFDKIEGDAFGLSGWDRRKVRDYKKGERYEDKEWIRYVVRNHLPNKFEGKGQDTWIPLFFAIADILDETDAIEWAEGSWKNEDAKRADIRALSKRSGYRKYDTGSIMYHAFGDNHDLKAEARREYESL